MNLAEAPTEIEGHGLLKGKAVVVTAAAGTGIGSSTARRALVEGADVVVSDYHERRLTETRDELAALGLGKVAAVVCDVTSTEAVDALITESVAALGRIDVLVNNAGLGGETPVADMTDDQWDRVLDVTLTSTFRATRAALRYFREAGHGRGDRQQRERVGLARAIRTVALCRRQGRRHGPNSLQCHRGRRARVRVNAVAPSIARHKFLDKVTSSDLLDKLSSDEAFGRAAEPWEVAATIAFLASDYSSYLTGEVISVSSQRA